MPAEREEDAVARRAAKACRAAASPWNRAWKGGGADRNAKPQDAAKRRDAACGWLNSLPAYRLRLRIFA